MNKPKGGFRTSITDIPVCNDRLVKEVALLHRLEQSEVRAMTEFIGHYIARVISDGSMEAVMIPHFGKFKPKKRKIETAAKVKANESNGMDLLFRALTGKQLVDKRINPNPGLS